MLSYSFNWSEFLEAAKGMGKDEMYYTALAEEREAMGRSRERAKPGGKDVAARRREVAEAYAAKLRDLLNFLDNVEHRKADFPDVYRRLVERGDIVPAPKA